MIFNSKFLLFNTFLFLLLSHLIYCENSTNSTEIEYNNNDKSTSIQGLNNTEIINGNKTTVEKCLNNTDCASSKCDTVKQICIEEVENQVNKKENENENKNSTNYTLYIVIGIAVVVGVVLIGIIGYVCTESAQYMAENPEIKEFRKENKVDGVSSAIIAASCFA